MTDYSSDRPAAIERAFAHGEDDDGLGVPMEGGDVCAFFKDAVKGYVPEYADRQKPNSIFDAEKHRKYLGKYYFQTKKEERQNADENSFKPMDDARRGEDSKKAYFDFLEGLQQINQQEYLDPLHTGFDWQIAAKNKIMLCGKPQDIEADFETMKRMKALAHWEREMRNRANAYQTQLFHDQLLRRAEKGTYEEKGAQHQEHDPPPLRGIRKETYEQLTRPLEKDFTIAGAAVYIVSIVISLFTLYSQIRVLVLVCPVGFMCPSQSRTVGYPVLAPPVQFRSGVNETAVAATRGYVNRYRPWSAKLTPLCSIRNDAGCERGGYLIQWPYVQTTSNGNATFPANLTKVCERFVRKEQGWMYDYHKGSIVPEYWKCPDKKRLPFVSEYTTTWGFKGLSEFHFEPAFYEKTHDRTLTCMSEALDGIGAESGISNWTGVVNALPSVTELVDGLRSCMAGGEPLEDMRKCACGLNEWERFAAGLFHEDAEEATHVCGSSSGRRRCDPRANASSDALASGSTEDQGSLLDPISSLFGGGGGGVWTGFCPAGQECVRKYEDEVPLNRAELFGCWFTAPDAAARLPADYYSCSGGIELGSPDKYVGMSVEDRQRQQLLDMVLSKRTVLLLAFMVKEGTVVTGSLVYFALTSVLVSVLMIFYIFVLLPLKTIKPDLSFTINKTMLALKDAIAAQMFVLFWMCMSLSSVLRTLVKVSQVASMLVNPSIRDMDDKIASVANTVFSLAVLLVMENGSQSGIVASLVLTLMQLIYQMTVEKVKLRKVMMPLRDLNENRLTKFEVALLWVKILEDFLPDDVQYNWVQIFQNKELLKPFDVDFPVTYQKPSVESGGSKQVLRTRLSLLQQSVDWVFDRLFAENNIISKSLTQRIPLALEKEFGHDGAGWYEQEVNAAQAKDSGSEQTVEWADVGESDAEEGLRRRNRKDRVVKEVRFKGEGVEARLMKKAWGDAKDLKRPPDSFLAADMFHFRDGSEFEQTDRKSVV